MLVYKRTFAGPFNTNKPWLGPTNRRFSSQVISSGSKVIMYSACNDEHRLDVFDVRTSSFIQSLRLNLALMPEDWLRYYPLVRQFWSLSGRLCFWYERDKSRLDVLLPQIQEQ